MLTLMWLKGLLLYRRSRLLGVVIGVAVTVAFLALLGAFIASSAASMTARAVQSVPVDWQVQLVPNAAPAAAAMAISAATPYTAVETVGYAATNGLTATTGNSTQTTGPAQILGVSPHYARQFPTQFRVLTGRLDGVLVAQQTAANLHVTVGDTVTIQRIDQPPVSVQIAGIVDMPQADSIFQVVGATIGATPQAPPDNVLVLPLDQWHQLFDAQAAARPDTVHMQLHVVIAHALPADPAAAFIRVSQLAHNVEARLAGSGVIGDNLAARLDAARTDAIYARVLFLFLGLPGVVLAILLTLAVITAGSVQRRQDQAFLRVHGAATSNLMWLAAMEAGLVAVGGTTLGIGLAWLLSTRILPLDRASGWTVLPWFAFAMAMGIIVAVLAVLIPAWQEAHRSTIGMARVVVGKPRKPLWQQIYLDVILLLVSAVSFWQIAGAGYQIVLAPEGVAQTAVSYQAFIAPVSFWIGAGLLVVRLWSYTLLHGRQALGFVLRPLAQNLADVIAAGLGRQRRLVTRGVVLVTLAVSFATSTAMFNTTYAAQARVDAELTNGADVLVSGSTAVPAGDLLSALRVIPGVATAQPLQHRFAYVGADLQDLFGVDALQLGTVTSLSNAFFVNGDAQGTLAALATHPDGILVSDETVHDFQLQPGDQINLRLQSAQDHQYHVVPFRFLGIVREFPTAPKDSFLVANAAYISQQTGTAAAETVLVRSSVDPGMLATRIRSVIGASSGSTITDIDSTQRTISSTLTAVDLRGLTRLELSFALLLVIGSTGLVLALGFAERRRTFALLTALGANRAQLGAFVWSEGLLVLVVGGCIGGVMGIVITQMLVRLLTGVFDPPPEQLAVPWIYLVMLMVIATLATCVALASTQWLIRRQVVEQVRAQ